jgi:hypothetical protein
MKATIENLKVNREIIIETLTELFGAEKLKSKMQSLLNIVEESELFKTRDTIEECIDFLVELSIDSRRKTSKTAEMLSEMAERRGETWDSKKGKYVKF